MRLSVALPFPLHHGLGTPNFLLSDRGGGVNGVSAIEFGERFGQVAFGANLLTGLQMFGGGVEARAANFQLVQRVRRIFTQGVLFELQRLVQFTADFGGLALRQEFIALARAGLHGC